MPAPLQASSHRLVAALRVRQLEVIRTLADTGNMRAAAQQLHLSTAAVSKSLREAESLFDTALFQRLPRGVAPTPAGELVVQRARVLLAEVAQLSDDLATQRRGGGADILRIGAQPFIAWSLLPRVLGGLASAGELPPLRLIEGRLGDICRQLEAGEIDLLITMNAPSELGGLMPDGFVIEQIGREQWSVVCAPTHPAAPRRARAARRPWSELVTEPWILPPRPTAARLMLEQTVLAHGLAPIVPRIESMNAITNLNLAEQGAGLTLLARCVTDERLARGTLVEVPVQDLPPPVPIVMVYRARGAGRGVVAAFREAVQRLSRSDGVVSASSSPSAPGRKLSARRSRA